MCGLSGIVITKPELIPMVMVKGIFSLLMEENDSRGGHSWGAWGSKKEPVRGLGKYMPNSSDFHKHFRDFQFMPDGEPTFIFGHTRFGTHGGRTVENSHPFEIGNLTLAHNGVVDVDGLTKADHEVDSGQIAIAITQDNWAGGMARVQGSCALLVSVNNTPMIYRHNQVLHYAIFDWGTVICSLKSDLELVITKKLGLEPITIQEVTMDAFTQPGWGTIYEAAPAKAYVYKAPAMGAWRGHFDSSWDDGYDTSPYGTGYGYRDMTKGTYTPPRRYEKPKYEKPTGLYGKGAMELQTIDSKRTPREKVADDADLDTEVDSPLNPIEIVDSVESEVELVDTCEYCGHAHNIDDLFRAVPSWMVTDQGNEEMLMCIDCIIDEILTNGICNVVGNYGSITNAPEEEAWRHML